MKATDTAEEWHRLQQLYAKMSDEEIEVLAAQGYELTDAAKDLLRGEISKRHLRIRIQDAQNEGFSSETAEIDPDDLVTPQRILDYFEAQRIKTILDNAGIPSFWGPDNSTGLNSLISRFKRGVDFKVRRADHERATALLGRETSDLDAEEEYTVYCPHCHSTEIIFESLDQETSSQFDEKFNWHCDACGFDWQDDGVEQQS